MNAIESVSPEERLSVAFDALKSDAEGFDRMTPLKVFRSPRESIRKNTQSKGLQSGKNSIEYCII